MAVEIDGQGDAVRAGAPVQLFDGPFDADSNNVPMAVDAHGDRFVMLQVHDRDDEGPDRTLITFVMNWFETLHGLGS